MKRGCSLHFQLQEIIFSSSNCKRQWSCQIPPSMTSPSTWAQHAIFLECFFSVWEIQDVMAAQLCCTCQVSYPLYSAFDFPQSHCTVRLIFHNQKAEKTTKNPPYSPRSKNTNPGIRKKTWAKTQTAKNTHEIVQNFPFLPRMEKRAADS